METTTGNRFPWWYEGASLPTFPKLNKSRVTDVLIVGAGISGLTTAYLCAKEGKKVIVIDDGEICSGETGRSTAHLANGLDDHYVEIQKEHGKEGAKLAAESHMAAIDLIEDIVKTEKIECDFERISGYLYRGPNTSDPIFLEKELKAARESGIDAQMVRSPHGIQMDSEDAIMFPRQGQIDPLRYIHGLARACQEKGVEIFTHTQAVTYNTSQPYKSEVITSDDYKISSIWLLLATNVPENDRITMYSKMHPYRTYVITMTIPKGSLQPCLLWDSDDPYHYVRTSYYTDELDLLIVGGEDHHVGRKHDFSDRINNLIQWTRSHFPMVKDLAHHWSGNIMEPVDSMGFIGVNPGDSPNVFIITGDSGNGMTHGSLGAVIIRDMIMGYHNRWAKLYNPSRQMTSEVTEFIKENIQSQMSYKDWITPGEITDIENLVPGEGAIIRSGLRKDAVYKDASGKVFRCSAVCPHLKGIVSWNSYEKSWDCPVHGSRFDPLGNLLNGPAYCGLHPVNPDEMEVDLQKQEMSKAFRGPVQGKASLSM